MDITIDELLKGKSTLIKNKEFFPTKTYVEPFLERMSTFTDNFSVKVQLPSQMTLQQGKEDITFNRVLIEAKLLEKHCIDKHDEVIGFIYGLDVRKPVVKIYRGYENQACTNLCVFNPQWLKMQELIPGDPINYSGIKELMESTSLFPEIIKSMKSTFIDREERKTHLGQWIDFLLNNYNNLGYGKVKLATSTAIDAYKALFLNQDSNYYIPEGLEPSLFDVYNSFTQIITNDSKDILNKFEKTLLVGDMLNIR